MMDHPWGSYININNFHSSPKILRWSTTQKNHFYFSENLIMINSKRNSLPIAPGILWWSTIDKIYPDISQKILWWSTSKTNSPTISRGSMRACQQQRSHNQQPHVRPRNLVARLFSTVCSQMTLTFIHCVFSNLSSKLH